MGAADGKLMLDGVAWASNVLTSVCIIFINKVLMSQKNGYAFRFATTLCALHYLACSLSIWATERITGGRKVKLPLKDLAIFTVTANTSIVTLNLSLMLNSVGFYQIAKLLIIPFVCLVEKFWLGRVFTSSVITSVIIVILGVAVVTVTDVGAEGNPLGVAVAGLSVVSSGMQQIFCRTMQQQHRLSANELLSNTAPVQGWTLLALGPFLDKYVSGLWVNHYEWSTPAIAVLSLSCACAIFVNLSQFACLGRFSAVSFQVLGHSKTVCVLLGGWAFLGDKVAPKQLLGMALAVFGMVLYGFSTLPSKASKGALDSAAAAAVVKAKQSFGGDSEADSLISQADARADVKVTNSYRGTIPSPLRSSALHKSKIAENV